MLQQQQQQQQCGSHGQLKRAARAFLSLGFAFTAHVSYVLCASCDAGVLWGFAVSTVV